ncbi:hypothetical protein D3C84_905180 [compost metagenome]
MLVIDSDEVLLARMQCVPQMPSSWRNSARLTSRFSTMASMIRSQSARVSMASTACRRAIVALRESADSLPFSTRLPSWRSMPSIA